MDIQKFADTFFLLLALYQYKKQLTAAMEISVLLPVTENIWK